MADDPYAQFADHKPDEYAQFADHPGDAPPASPTASAPDTSFGSWLKTNAINPLGRMAVKAATALPLMAEDFGVAARNVASDVQDNGIGPAFSKLFSGGQYDTQLPSSTVNNALDSVMAPPTSTAGKVSEFAGSAIMGAGLPGPSSLGTVRAAFKGPLPNAVPSNFTPSITPAQQTLNQSQGAGYVFPPSTTNPTVSNKILESFGGKVATQQDASIANMQTTNSLARRALGMADDADLTPDALAKIRTDASSAKTALIAKAGPTVNMDQTYAERIAAITQPYRDAAAELGDRFGNKQLVDAADAVNKPNISPKVAMTAVDTMRADAQTAFRSGDNVTGKAYKALATNIEDAVDRHLVANGDTDVVNQFRDARVLQAKSFDVENSLNDATGNVNAGYFGRKLKNGGYLTDQLFTIGQAARMAPKATQEITDSGSVRNTDVALGMIGAIAKHEPTFLLYPFARQGARAAMLSDAGQKLANPGASFAPSPGLAGLSQSLFAQWDLAK